MYEACESELVGSALPGRPAFGETFVVADCEQVRDAKAHLNRHLPRERPYKETQDQKSLTSLLNIEMARQNSRSFQRFLSAMQESLVAIETNERTVTPQI